MKILVCCISPKSFSNFRSSPNDPNLYRIIFLYIIYLYLKGTAIQKRKLEIIFSIILPASISFFFLVFLSRLILASSSALMVQILVAFFSTLFIQISSNQLAMRIRVGSRKGSSPTTSSCSMPGGVKVGAQVLAQRRRASPDSLFFLQVKKQWLVFLAKHADSSYIY